MTTYYASDILESALRLAGVQTLNNLTFKDACALLNEKYQQVYQAITNKDPSLYSRIVRVESPIIEMTPNKVLRPVSIFTAQDPILPPRDYFRPTGNYGSRRDSCFYTRQGTSIVLHNWGQYRFPVWFEYVPVPQTITYCLNNRNPKLLKDYAPIVQTHFDFDRWSIDYTADGWVFSDLQLEMPNINLNELIYRPDHSIIRVVADWPYIYVTVQHDHSGRRHVYLYDRLPDSTHCSDWAPFDYTGRRRNLTVVESAHNDYTGLYAVFEEDNKYFEVGFCPDTRIDFPLLTPYNMLVGQVANRIGMLNGAVREAVQEALASANSEFNNMIVPDTSGWQTQHNVRPSFRPLDQL